MHSRNIQAAVLQAFIAYQHNGVLRKAIADKKHSMHALTENNRAKHKIIYYSDVKDSPICHRILPESSAAYPRQARERRLVTKSRIALGRNILQCDFLLPIFPSQKNKTRQALVGPKMPGHARTPCTSLSHLRLKLLGLPSHHTSPRFKHVSTHTVHLFPQGA